MKFTKMQGIGNDYVYINCLKVPVSQPEQLAKAVSDRHFGIGSDGLVLILPSEIADFRMDMYNADGSRAQMCGNAIRCVGKYVRELGLTDKDTITIETLAGIKTLTLHRERGSVTSVTVNMGQPILHPRDIPINLDGESCISKPIHVAGVDYRFTGVSMGNPHAIVYLPEIADLDIARIGPLFEQHTLFPERINTEFVRIDRDGSLHMRVWERGAGETLACGTGACAVLVASVLNGYSGREADIHLLGGTLRIRWEEEDNCVYMTGNAAFVFKGEFPWPA
jgi:diaminopimelate epimerase